MLSLRFSLVREIFAHNRINFFWRSFPGKDHEAVLEFLVNIRIEPYTMFITAGGLWSMGAFSYSQSSLPLETQVGRYCSIANAVTTFNSEHPVNWLSTSPFSYNPDAAPIFTQAIEDASMSDTYCLKVYDDKSHAPIYIGNDVWIGQHVQLKKGIKIGDGAVVAAGAVVCGDVEPYTVVGGVPAKIIRQRFDSKTVKRLNQLQWWRFQFTDFHDLDIRKVDKFLDGLESKIERKDLQIYDPEAVTIITIKNFLEHKAQGTDNAAFFSKTDQP